MPVTMPYPPEGPAQPPNRVRWTRDQCTLIQDALILVGRYELVDGEILSKMGQKPAHAYVIRAVMAWLIRIFGENAIQVQLPIHIVGDDAEYNEPEPDCAVLASPAKTFADHHPGPSELHLVVEISDSSLGFDLNTKARLYGNAGIAEYWVVDILARRLVVFRNPGATGYASIVAYSESEVCAALASPANTVLVSELLPPR